MNPHSHENEIQFLWGCGAALAGMVLGGLGFSALVALYYLLTDPTVRRDGQYGMIFMFTLPLGAAIGGALGFALPYAVGRKRT